MRGEDFLRGPSSERHSAADQLVPQHADRVDVHPLVDIGLADSLFRRHVGGSAERDAGAGELVAAGRLAQGLGHSEVGHQGMPSGEQHVVGLDVPVHHASGVGVGQGVAHLDHDLDRFVDRQFPLMRQSVPQVVPLDKGHHVVEKAVGLPRVEQRQDVRVLKPGCGGDLLEEPLGPDRRGQLGPQDLHRHLAPVLDVFGEVDGGHAAAAELALEPVAVLQGLGQGRVDGGHGV